IVEVTNRVSRERFIKPSRGDNDRCLKSTVAITELNDDSVQVRDCDISDVGFSITVEVRSHNVRHLPYSNRSDQFLSSKVAVAIAKQQRDTTDTKKSRALGNNCIQFSVSIQVGNSN